MLPKSSDVFFGVLRFFRGPLFTPDLTFSIFAFFRPFSTFWRGHLWNLKISWLLNGKWAFVGKRTIYVLPSGKFTAHSSEYAQNYPRNGPIFNYFLNSEWPKKPNRMVQKMIKKSENVEKGWTKTLKSHPDLHRTFKIHQNTCRYTHLFAYFDTSYTFTQAYN